MAVFQRSILLEATAAEVYSFHEDPRNISKISPPSLRVEQVECSVPAQEGEEFRLRVSQFGVPLEWVGVWEKVVLNKCLVDSARKSPFCEWRHEHFFQKKGERCLMTDCVHYALPWKILGRLLDHTVMILIFTMMFRARHKATQKYFAVQKNAPTEVA